MDVRILANDLIDAQKAHHKYEEENFGKEGDKNWADWYARFLLKKWNVNVQEPTIAEIFGGDIAG